MKSLISMSSDFISCNVGVRQGENVSPILFPLSDLENFFRLNRRVIKAVPLPKKMNCFCI